MPKIDLDAIEEVSRTGYPPPHDEAVRGRWQRRLGPPSGLTELGVNRVRLEPGAWSSQRHWHDGEDEFLVMLEGEAVLIEDEGRTLLRAGDCVGWPKGSTNGHHLINESSHDCLFLAFSAGPNTGGGYSDVDMKFTPEGKFVHRDGSPY